MHKSYYCHRSVEMACRLMKNNGISKGIKNNETLITVHVPATTASLASNGNTQISLNYVTWKDICFTFIYASQMKWYDYTPKECQVVSPSNLVCLHDLCNEVQMLTWTNSDRIRRLKKINLKSKLHLKSIAMFWGFHSKISNTRQHFSISKYQLI